MWARDTEGGCTIAVRVTPRASRPDVRVGDESVGIRVASPAAQGRATTEAARRLADALGLAPSRVQLRRGAGAREKVFSVVGISAETARRRLQRRE